MVYMFPKGPPKVNLLRRQSPNQAKLAYKYSFIYPHRLPLSKFPKDKTNSKVCILMHFSIYIFYRLAIEIRISEVSQKS